MNCRCHRSARCCAGRSKSAIGPAETAVSKTSGFRRSLVLREEKEAVMRFLIVGAGALGGYYGGMLLKGGADVTFLVRPRRAAQLAERGLTIKEADNTFTTSVRTVQAGALGAADARQVMVEGASSILAISPGPERPLYE